MTILETRSFSEVRRLHEGAGFVCVTQIRSAIGTKPKQRGTLRALGLRGIGSSNLLPDRPEIRGMVHRVPHLVDVSVDVTQVDYDERRAKVLARRRSHACPDGNAPTPGTREGLPLIGVEVTTVGNTGRHHVLRLGGHAMVVERLPEHYGLAWGTDLDARTALRFLGRLTGHGLQRVVLLVDGDRSILDGKDADSALQEVDSERAEFVRADFDGVGVVWHRTPVLSELGGDHQLGLLVKVLEPVIVSWAVTTTGHRSLSKYGAGLSDALAVIGSGK